MVRRADFDMEKFDRKFRKDMGRANGIGMVDKSVSEKISLLTRIFRA